MTRPAPSLHLAITFGLIVGVAACDEDKSDQDAKDTATATATATAETAKPAEEAPTKEAAAKPESQWLKEHGGEKILFGFRVPGGGKVSVKPGGFKYSTGKEVSVVYPTGDDKDVILAFQSLAEEDGVDLISEDNPIGTSWKVIHADKPYKAFVVKRHGKDELVLSIKTP